MEKLKKMNNKEVIELALKNKKYHFKTFLSQCSLEVLEDIFQDILIQLMTKDKILSLKESKGYINVAIKNNILLYKLKNKRFTSNEIEVDNKIMNIFDKLSSDVCYYENTEKYQEQQFKLRDMRNHIDNLHPKQKLAVLAVLKGKGSTTDANFKQAMRTLRNVMGGKIFTTNPEKYKPKSNKRGPISKLNREAILDIRANVVPGKNGDLIRKDFYAEKYKVNKKVVYKIAKGLSYKEII